MQLTGYPILLLLILFAAILPFVLMGISQIVQIKFDTKLKQTTYESGMDTFGDSRVQFDVKFYLFALLFILFDIETIFLFPWAVGFEDLVNHTSLTGPSMYPIWIMVIFVNILLGGLIYAWKRGALRWQ